MDLATVLESIGLGHYNSACAAAGIDIQSFGLLGERGLDDLGVTAEDRPAMLFLVKQLEPPDVGMPEATVAEPTPSAAAVAAASESAPKGGAAVVGAASAAAHFAALDDAAHDEELPWAPSQWIEGDSLAPPCSSNLEVVDALLALAKVEPRDVLVDLGAGDGRVCVQACLAHGATAWGVEIDAEEVAKFHANVAAFDLADRCSCVEGDLTEALTSARFQDVTVVSLYLLPDAIATLRPHLEAALQRGVRIVTNTWGLPWRTPYATAVARHGFGNTTNLSLYQLSNDDERDKQDDDDLPVGNLKDVVNEIAHQPSPQASAGCNGSSITSSAGSAGGGNISSNSHNASCEDGGEWLSATSADKKQRRQLRKAETSSATSSSDSSSTKAHDAAVDAFLRLVLPSSPPSSSKFVTAADGRKTSTVPPTPPPSTHAAPRLNVVVLRGLSGCGKSTFTQKLGAAATAAGYTFVVCSADKYFEDTSTGRYVFDVSKLGEAHASCKAAFDNALKQHATAAAAAAASAATVADASATLAYAGAVVVVDNTNTCYWEYEPYLQASNAAAADFTHVVEFTLPISSSQSSQPSTKSTASTHHRVGGQGKGANAHQGKGASSHGWTTTTSHGGGNNRAREQKWAVLETLAARNAHGVPLDALARMLERWEDDYHSFEIPAGGF